MREAMQENRWMSDIEGELGMEGAQQCVRLWVYVNSVRRELLDEDMFISPWSRGGEYLASSTY